MRPLKVHFANCNFSSSTGPNTFAHRLAVQLSNDGYVLADPDDYDVALAFIEEGRNRLRGDRPIVQRLDGIWFKPQDFDRRNEGIRSLYRRADHVVFQSEFDRKMVEKWWEGPKRGTVIHNGIEQARVPKHPGLDDLRRGSQKPGCERSPYEKIFVSSSNWHPQKRLRDNIALFEHLRKTVAPDSCLIILGSTPDVKVANPHVFYAGSVSHETCLQIYAAADWMIHLAWLDHCPNVVVEALSQRLPVICSERGGTKEIVGNNGLVLRDEPYDFDLMDYDNPPRIDVTQVTELPNIVVDPSHLDIVAVAHRYEEIFEELVP